MRRNFLRSLLICLIPTLAAAAFVGYGVYKETNGDVGFRRGIDLAGGTILVYEVDADKRGGKPLANDEIKTLAEKLKKRIDENDLYNVVVRPVGNNRVEIILPFAAKAGGQGKAANAEYVEDVRQKVKQAGVLKFTILANQNDDAAGIKAAQALVDDPSEETKKKLADAADRGLPPPAPDEEFMVKAAGADEYPVRYVWLELGKERREEMGISDRHEKTPPATWNADNPRLRTPWMFPEFEARRNKTYLTNSGDTSALYYSRPFTKKADLRSSDEREKKFEYFVLTRESDKDTLAVKDNVRVSANSSQDPNGYPAVGFQFTTPSGAKQFREMTERNRRQGFHRQMAIVLDDRVVSDPQLNEPLPGGGIIQGRFSQDKVNTLVSILRSGNLNAELKPDPVSENTIGATLGETTKRNGLIAVAGSFAAVLLFMVFYYRFAGLVACVALFVNLLMTVGFMVAMNAAFTLPGLAGMVLMLGMAVDANVLIYERLREEREKGANLTTAIRNGYDRALLTIIDTHLTSIFTSVVLYTFGNDALKGFSVALTVGLIISLFTSLYITRLIFDYWTHKRWLTELRMLRLFARPRFDFMRVRHYMFALTGFLTVVGLGVFLARGERALNVDFTQGTAYGGRLTEPKTLTEVKDLLGEERQKAALQVAAVEPAILGGDEAGRTAEQIYDITYADGQKATVALSNPPEGATPAEQLANLKARAAHLPDVSVEQVFVGDDASKLGDGRSLSFTLRTTEREKELVQVMLDRLLRDGQNQPLIEKARVTDLKVAGPVATLTFDRPVSPAYFRDFVLRELRIAGRLPQAVDPNTVVKVDGVASANPEEAAVEGRELKYKTVTVDVSKNTAEVGFPHLSDPNANPARKQEDLKSFERALTAAKAGFEFRPVPDRLETFDPALAKDTRNKALMAILISWVAILAFLWFRFGSWQFGLAAVLCLVHDLCFTLGAITACHYVHDTTVGRLLRLHDFKIDLAAVAALLTLVGYSVNEIIVNFARIREVRGKSPVLTPQMINDSVNQTLSRSVLTSMTVFLVSFVLYWFGGEGVHLFAFVMVMGVLISTYSSIYIASPLLLIFGEGKAKFPTAASGGGGGGGPAAPTAEKPGDAPAVSAIAS